MPISYLAVDPGHMCGYALFDEVGDIVEYGQFRMEEAVQKVNGILTNNKIKAIICEDYRNHAFKNGQQQKRWSRNETSKIIGKIETLAELQGVSVVLQPNYCKSAGYQFAGIEPPANHSISHQFDAYAHGVFWLQEVAKVRPIGKALMEQRNND